MKDNNDEKNKQFFIQNYFTPRVKENETKNKPKILTEHLPGVFTMRQKDNIPISNPKKIFQYNNNKE